MSDLSYHPATPEVSGLDPDFLIVGPFVRYEAVPDTPFGRITMSGNQPLGGTRLESSRGAPILPLAGNWETDYLDFSEAEAVVKARPTFDGAFDKAEVLTREEATLAGVPACLVSFSGPVVGTQAHDAEGDLTIGFATPGTYTIAFEAFPYLATALELVVKPRTSAQVDLGVTL